MPAPVVIAKGEHLKKAINDKELSCESSSGFNSIINNWFRYRMTDDGVRFHSTWHRTHDKLSPPFCDEGTPGKYDWSVWISDLIPSLSGPEEICREGSSVGFEDDGVPGCCEE